VSGLWHLGCVTAACLSERYRVIAHDMDSGVVANLKNGIPPVHEPGLSELLRSGLDSGQLSCTNDAKDAASADIVWITYDTPVNEHDESDVKFVENAICELLPHVSPGTLIIISSQVPVGFTKRMEAVASAMARDVSFSYLPENLRLGEALRAFRQPDRIVAGVRSPREVASIGLLLAPFSANVVWMSPESAEMTKHALNAFLATSITFINEISELCENVDADVKDVQIGLRSDARIGARAYLTAGSGFAGGTLARDLRTLSALGRASNIATPVLDSVLIRNQVQQRWTERSLLREIGTASGKNIAILGLAYKPGTDTLRRSMGVELALRMHAQGATVTVYDPAIRQLPENLTPHFTLAAGIDGALEDADAAVIATSCAEFRRIDPKSFHRMKARIVIDPQRYLEDLVCTDTSIRYVGVGLRSKQTL
jgi:UDPglucose 6-dehydrogenase